MALPAAFLDELRARTPIAAVVGRRVRLARSGRQWKGCCPFHGEKTPSFHVYEDHYHCFGCGAHGDAISFVMQSQGASFGDAVEQLAGEAGLDVPRASPAAVEAERRRVDLHGVLAAATRVFARRLSAPEGARALDYLRGRGLTDETIRRFELGWSGEGRGALAEELSRGDIAPDMLMEAGLLRPGEDGRPGGELFFNRVMFPIRDRRGRVISFGGRILGQGQPKYVNGPETPLFSKRRTLFGLDFAREAARGGATVVAVEGYMDVIALHQAGFSAAVAPLGTALTQEQLEELWRLSPAPILCFDGDAAGARAAARAADLALPFLAANRTLLLATLPSGEDPDSLVRKGPGDFQAVLGAARPLSDALYDLVRESTGEATPEQRAELRARLDAAAARIRDKALSSEYRQALRDRFFAARSQARTGGSGTSGNKGFRSRQVPFARPLPSEATTDFERARTLVGILLRYPGVLHDVDEAFGALDLPAPWDRLRAAILAFSDTGAANAAEPLDSASLMNHLTHCGLAAEAAQALSAVPSAKKGSASSDLMPSQIAERWWEMCHFIRRNQLETDIRRAERQYAESGDESAYTLLIALRQAQIRLNRGEFGDDIDL
jgi:DNA primase